jgi:hypothetical protein
MININNMSRLNKILERYGKVYGVLYEQDPVAAPPAPAPPPGAMPAAPAPAAAPPPAPEPEAPSNEVANVQRTQDALGIDPSKLQPNDQSVFKDEVTPKNANVKRKKIDQIIQDNEPPTAVR